jgi:hypothetical protein
MLSSSEAVAERGMGAGGSSLRVQPVFGSRLLRAMRLAYIWIVGLPRAAGAVSAADRRRTVVAMIGTWIFNLIEWVVGEEFREPARPQPRARRLRPRGAREGAPPLVLVKDKSRRS